ncbi:hypothetical protein LCGC14_1563120 [marine sediment metagenome]|uniref:Uncharacterized protein n=1 Tax=marine sediment metagenome TaxID=412755 RepID=A0A0F9L372_9ZZZZ
MGVKQVELTMRAKSIMKVAEDTMTWQDKLKRLRNKVLVKLEPLRRIGRSVR